MREQNNMLLNSTFFQMSIHRGEAISIIDPRLCELHCISGRLWLTEENAGVDLALAPGERFVLRRPGRTVIEAVDQDMPAVFRIYPVAEQPARASWRWILTIWSKLRSLARVPSQVAT